MQREWNKSLSGGRKEPQWWFRNARIKTSFATAIAGRYIYSIATSQKLYAFLNVLKARKQRLSFRLSFRYLMLHFLSKDDYNIII